MNVDGLPTVPASHGARRWRDGEARTRALFREVNERIHELAAVWRSGADEKRPFVCECGNPECVQEIVLTGVEYEQIRARGNRFAIAVGHENPETETVVEEDERFAVVESYAVGGSRIARGTDPRSQLRLGVRP
jgi:hypothetical protein